MIKRILCSSVASLAVWGCTENDQASPPPPPAAQVAPSRDLAGIELGERLSLHHVMNVANITSTFESTFLGLVILEHPNDMWMIQEMITEIQPDVIIETGTLGGGSALYYASILKEVNENGKVITIDIAPVVDEWIEKIKATPHMHRRVEALFRDRIEVITSNSVDPKLVADLAERVRGKRVMVMLDSCHNYEHVLKELELYSPMVSVGSYIIVQDTIIDKGIAAGSQLMKEAAQCPGYEQTGGPGKAATEFLAKNDNFEIDQSRERFFVSFFPSGYLKRIK